MQLLLRLHAIRGTKFMKINKQVDREWDGHIYTLHSLKPLVTIVKVWNSLEPILISRLANNYNENLKKIKELNSNNETTYPKIFFARMNTIETHHTSYEIVCQRKYIHLNGY